MSTTNIRRHAGRVAVALIATLVALGAVACGSGSVAAPGGGAEPPGPAVTVPADYQAPTDRVDTTGAYLPANGKPTLVYVDAIW